ncbi:hypothetical protein [Kitasatospora sp. NPDC086791]|uniref:hypothetical protein n=1 Tax=Kitasatospora sp. NPDC086791 TaxID=3155178 RepID=UPI003447155F
MASPGRGRASSGLPEAAGTLQILTPAGSAADVAAQVAATPGIAGVMPVQSAADGCAC